MCVITVVVNGIVSPFPRMTNFDVPLDFFRNLSMDVGRMDAQTMFHEADCRTGLRSSLFKVQVASEGNI